jgi:hypothetical protein
MYIYLCIHIYIHIYVYIYIYIYIYIIRDKERLFPGHNYNALREIKDTLRESTL